MDLDSKQKSFEALLSGKLGNRIRMWNNYEELISSGFDGKVGMRYKGQVGGSGKIKYSIPVSSVREIMSDWVKSGLNKNKIVFSEDCPDHNLTIQGEFLRGDDVPRKVSNSSFYRAPMIELFYSTEPTKMRIALAKSGRRVYGIEARTILRHFLDPNSLEWLYELSEMFRNHVIEFSTYTMFLGTIPYRNTIIWEVRKY